MKEKKEYTYTKVVAAIPPEMDAAIRKICYEQRISMSRLVREGLDVVLARYKMKGGK